MRCCVDWRIEIRGRQRIKHLNNGVAQQQAGVREDLYRHRPEFHGRRRQESDLPLEISSASHNHDQSLARYGVSEIV